MDFLKDLSIDSIRNAAEDAFNQVKPKNEVETRVYEVLSHKNWGASSSVLNDIARDTYDPEKFPQVTRLMWDALENQRPAAWRLVFKGLSLLEHLIKNGSERCVDDARNHGHTIKALHQFNYYEGTVDRGHGVREKSKQIAEIMGDDERIREERQKAKKLREKFGSAGATSSGGGGGQYAGYGNDSSGWSGGGGGGGYGDSGLGSGRGGGYGDSDTGKFSGRYSDESGVQSSSGGGGGSATATPTFAALPEVAPKKKKKKKKAEIVPAPAAPEIDLFSFDTPASAPADAVDHGFDAFQSAPAPSAVVDPFALSTPGPNDFGNFNSAPQPAAPAFQQFDAFATQTQQPINSMMAGSSSFNAFGNTVSQQGMMNTMSGSGMMSGMQQIIPTTVAPAAGGDDDFGDFENAAAPSQAVSSSSDPLSKLISLDGLTKNTKKEVPSMLHQPIAATPAAQQYLQYQQQAQAQGLQTLTMNPAMSFRGIDGLNKPVDFGVTPQSNHSNGQVVMGGANVTAGGADMISMMAPIPQQQPIPQQAQMGQMTPQQMMYVQQQMMAQQMMAQQQMQGGMMLNQQGMGMSMQSGMGNSTQMGMNQQGMGGMNPQMNMQAGMNPQMSPMGASPQMGQMNQQGMMNQSMGHQQFGNNNMMGGQPMGGWR